MDGGRNIERKTNKQMKKYIKPITEIHPAYIEEEIMMGSTNNNSVPVIGGDGLPKIENGEEILSPKFNLWDYEEEEQ